MPDAKLYFLGLQLGQRERQADAGGRAGPPARATSSGLDKSVIFGDWAPYDLREAYLLEADVALTAARDLAETRLSFRTRVLDYLWAGLPVVATDGDVLVRPGPRRAARRWWCRRATPARWPAAMVRLLQQPGAARRVLGATRPRSPGASPGRWRWSRCAGSVLEPWRWEDARRLRPRHRQLTEEVRGLLLDRNRVNGAYGTGRLRGRILLRDRDFGSLEEYVGELEATVQHLDRRMDLLRRTPIYPAFRAARRARNWARTRLKA